MSRRYELASAISISGDEADLDLLNAILEDEEQRVGSRAYYAVSRDANGITIAVDASDATALKTAISAVSGIIRTAEQMNTIGE